MTNTGGSASGTRPETAFRRAWRLAVLVLTLAAPAAAPAAPAAAPAAPAGTAPEARASGVRASASVEADGVVGPVTTRGMGTSVALKGWIPDDRVAGVPWTDLQWNFVGSWGVGATRAWDDLRTSRYGRPGGAGVKIAVIDSGVAYRTQGRYRQSPDLPRERVLQGYDFVDNDRFPDDQSGHGTHVASTIAGQANNQQGLTGLAYNATILPIRVLDDRDRGDVVTVARGIRYAVRKRVDIINLSVDFPVETTTREVPEVMRAIAAARRAGILIIASSGNDGVGQVSLPARSSSVLAVGATTARGCRSTYSNGGSALDLVAPGGGMDHRSERSWSRCRPGESGPPIAQVTLLRSGEPGTLGVPMDYVGTSMAAAHVTAIAALVRASGILGRDPSPDLLAAYLVRSTRDLGDRGHDERYGSGLISARAAANRTIGRAAVRGAKAAVARGSRSRSTALALR